MRIYISVVETEGIIIAPLNMFFCYRFVDLVISGIYYILLINNTEHKHDEKKNCEVA